MKNPPNEMLHSEDEPVFNEDNEIYDHISSVLMTLSEVTLGNFTVRVEATDLPANHPAQALIRGVNETIEGLERMADENGRYRRDLEEKISMIERQTDAIRELSTPVIELWDSVLCLPLIGVLDSVRSAEMTDTLLMAIGEKRARCAIVDITGITVMDTGTADHLLRMVKAVRLLGAQCILTGISPIIAQTIVQLGIDVTGVTTYRSLREALQEYVWAHLEHARDKQPLRRS